MKRFIEDTLLGWKLGERRKPLILRGARQIGKTYTVRKFGEEHFKNVVVVDLEKNLSWHRIFTGDLDISKIISELEIVTNEKIEAGRSLLFLDEIQSCPRALMSLRYFNEERPELHVIAAGSLLDFAMKDISFPVGRVQFLEMYPLNFAEYLLAINKTKAAEIMMLRPKKLSETVHNFLLDELKNYFLVGGMPESVSAYVNSSSIRESFKVHHEICNAYRQDFQKYAPRADKQCLDSVFISSARDVGKQIKYAHLAEGYSGPTIKKAFELLCMARVVSKVSSVTPAGIPLAAGASGKIFKSIFVDIGLMGNLCGIRPDIEYSGSNLLSIYKGAIAEQFVGQELLQTQGGAVYYWSRQAKSSTAEVDFVAVSNAKIIPVEVKSGAPGSLKSMRILLDKYKNVPYGVVLSTSPYLELPEKRLVYCPLYYAYSSTGGKVNQFVS